MYVLLCGDQSLYTGYAKDVYQRLQMHQTGRGAKYTKHRQPLRLLYAKEWPDKTGALKAEYAFKQLTRSQKLKKLEDWGCFPGGDPVIDYLGGPHETEKL